MLRQGLPPDNAGGLRFVSRMIRDQRNEYDAAEILLFEPHCRRAGQTQQPLDLAMLADGHHKTAADVQLIFQRRRHGRAAGGNDDGIEGRVVRVTAAPVARHYADVLTA